MHWLHILVPCNSSFNELNKYREGAKDTRLIFSIRAKQKQDFSSKEFKESPKAGRIRSSRQDLMQSSHKNSVLQTDLYLGHLLYSPKKLRSCTVFTQQANFPSPCRCICERASKWAHVIEGRQENSNKQFKN